MVNAEKVGLIFVGLPKAVTKMPDPRFIWALFLFLMILTLGIGTAFGLLEMLVCTAMDFFPQLRKFRAAVVSTICIAGFLFGLSMCFSNGIQTLDLLDHATNIAILLVGAIEMIAFGWCLGPEAVFQAMLDMGIRTSKYMRFYLACCWTLGPIALFIVIIGTLYGRPKFGKHPSNPEGFSTGVQVIGGIITAFPVLIILAGFVYVLYWHCRDDTETCNVNYVIDKIRSISSLFRPLEVVEKNIN